MADVWRYCEICGWVGPTLLKRCAVCAEKTKEPGCPLQVLPIPVDALRAAFSMGGGDAVMELLADCFKVTAVTIEILIEKAPEHFLPSIFHGLTLKLPGE